MSDFLDLDSGAVERACPRQRGWPSRETEDAAADDTLETASTPLQHPLANLKSTFKKLTSMSASKAMDTDSKDDAKPKMRKVKKQVRKGEPPIVSGTSSLDTTQQEFSD